MKKKMLLLAFTLTIAVLGNLSQASDESQNLTDGPYISIGENGRYYVEGICRGKVVNQNIIISESVDFCSEQYRPQVPMEKPINYQFDNVNKVAAISDPHGQYELLLQLLKNNQIVDSDNRWRFGSGHLVLTGDVFDRGDSVTEILWFLYHLEQQAEQAGGKFHFLLGNHETMVLNGDLRYLHPKYLATEKKLKRPFASLFSQNTVLGKWLRSKSVAVKINDTLFAHGGFHPDLAKSGITLADLNHLFSSNLIEVELGNKTRAGWGRYLHKKNGPIWYRGYFKEGGITSQQVSDILTHFDIQRVVVGHTTQEQITPYYGGRIVAIDSGMKRGKYGEVLFIDYAQPAKVNVSVGDLEGQISRLK